MKQRWWCVPWLVGVGTAWVWFALLGWMFHADLREAQELTHYAGQELAALKLLHQQEVQGWQGLQQQLVAVEQAIQQTHDSVASVQRLQLLQLDASPEQQWRVELLQRLRQLELRLPLP